MKEIIINSVSDVIFRQYNAELSVLYVGGKLVAVWEPTIGSQNEWSLTGYSFRTRYLPWIIQAHQLLRAQRFSFEVSMETLEEYIRFRHYLNKVADFQSAFRKFWEALTSENSDSEVPPTKKLSAEDTARQQLNFWQSEECQSGAFSALENNRKDRMGGKQTSALSEKENYPEWLIRTKNFY